MWLESGPCKTLGDDLIVVTYQAISPGPSNRPMNLVVVESIEYLHPMKTGYAVLTVRVRHILTSTAVVYSLI